jgi:hypothetical protein
MNLNDEIDLSKVTGHIQKMSGYIGAVALLLGGLQCTWNFP